MTQDIRVVDGESEKNRLLYQCLEKVMDGSKVLIFTSTKRMADTLTSMLRRDGWPARAIHGDKSVSPAHAPTRLGLAQRDDAMGL